MRKVLVAASILLVALAGSIGGANYLFVTAPASAALDGDVRNDGIDLDAHFGMYVQPDVLVLDLRRVNGVAPADLMRALFQVADALSDRNFSSVFLSARGERVFRLPGRDFVQLGHDFAQGENPVYLMRKFPSLLEHPDGVEAYGEWTGGLLGVVAQEMEDLNDAMLTWSDRAIR